MTSHVLRPFVTFHWDDVSEKVRIISELATIHDWLRFLTSEFNRSGLSFGHGTCNSVDEAAWLVAEVLELDATLLEQYLGCKVLTHEKNRIYDIAKRRCQSKKPLAQIIEKAYLYGVPFFVNDDVHVPKSPIPELISQGFSPYLSFQPQKIADCCTGSGSLAILLALYFDEATVIATDIDAKALQVAEKNVNDYDLADRVQLVECDLLSGVMHETFDLIVANPPYVAEEEWESLPEEYHHEPKIALVSEDSGLFHALQVIQQAEKCLAPGGILVVEVGLTWPHLQERLPLAPFLWPDFEQGGEGVFILHQSDLQAVIAEIKK